MKKNLIPVLTLATLCLSGCETMVNPTTGKKRTVLKNEGVALMNVFVSAAVGMGTGALMNNSPGFAAGAVGGAAGSVGSQVVAAVIPTKQNSPGFIPEYGERPAAPQFPQQLPAMNPNNQPK